MNIDEIKQLKNQVMTRAADYCAALDKVAELVLAPDIFPPPAPPSASTAGTIAPATPAPRKQVKAGSPPKPSRAAKRGGSSLTFPAALREVMGEATGEVSANWLMEQIQARFPQVAPKLSNLSGTLMRWVEWGELIRTGTGTTARYEKTTKWNVTGEHYGRGPSDKERAYQKLKEEMAQEKEGK